MSKRKRGEVYPTKGLAPGERIKRKNLAPDPSWGWVYTSVPSKHGITLEHRKATCGFSRRTAVTKPVCPNKYTIGKGKGKDRRNSDKEKKEVKGKGKAKETVVGALNDDDIIDISDSDADDEVEEVSNCSKKACLHNPNCLNYMGQRKWEDENDAYDLYVEASGIGDNPELETRDPDRPIGLKNLGATCYANAFLQVWFRDLAFRSGVYKCLPLPMSDGATSSSSTSQQDSPIFQLQVTFAAFQHLNQSVFNPVKLVESLQLRASEQQDAQEFSKLFMSLLADQFGKQSVPELKNLVSSQFEGTLTYGTLCSFCKNRSERDSKFCELELNLESNCKIEDRIAALLQSEKLSGDNKYHCSNCDTLRDALRYTSLRSLPPVLHFSLLRFIFDVETLTRKKSKQAITFPLTIDMAPFLNGNGSDALKGGKVKGSNGGECLYELKGILLHKGASAYHGHYEAQVFDPMKKEWYQFNDELVTPISPVSGVGKGKKEKEKEKQNEGDKPRRSSFRSKMIVKSDEEMEEIKPTNGKLSSSTTNKKGGALGNADSGHVTSKDAYMLIYARKDTSSLELEQEKECPPAEVMQEIARLNEEYDQACKKYKERLQAIREEFDRVRQIKLDVFQNWTISSHDEESIVVDQDTLENWVLKGLVSPAKDKEAQDNGEDGEKEKDKEMKDPFKRSSPVPMDLDPIAKGSLPTPPMEQDPNSSETVVVGHENVNSPSRNEMDNSAIVCPHGLLNPLVASRMKRISKIGYQKIVNGSDGRRFEPELLSTEVCSDCVEAIFEEKLYMIEHQDIVRNFEAVEDVHSQLSPSVWISKAWLKDWKLNKPKFHDPNRARGDPQPDTEPWKSDVICEHEGLTPTVANRKLISSDSANLLRDLFPEWRIFTVSHPRCPTCMESSTASRIDSQALRKKIEAEKLQVKLTENPTTFATTAYRDKPVAVMPSSFIKAWFAWKDRPLVNPRPQSVDMSQLICEHDLLCFDPNMESDISDSNVCLVEWEKALALGELYGGQIVEVTLRVQNDGLEGYLEHNIAICHDCRIRRRSEFEDTKLVVYLLPTGAPLPNPEAYAERRLIRPGIPLKSITPAAGDLNSSSSSSLEKKGTLGMGNRQSTRIRERKHKPTRKEIRVSKKDTVKDMKIRIHKQFDIPTIYQRLFWRGNELIENKMTVDDVGILLHDVLELHELKPPDDDDAIWNSDADVDVPVKKRKEEGRAFGGTLLGGGVPQKAVEATSTTASSSTTTTPIVKDVTPSSKSASLPPEETEEDPMDLLMDSDSNSNSKDEKTIKCNRCTFENPAGVSSCTMCEAEFDIDLDI